MVYAIQANVVFKTPDGHSTSRQIATFFLDSNLQGIVSAAHAEEIAKRMLEHTEQFTAHVTVCECDADTAIIRPLEDNKK